MRTGKEPLPRGFGSLWLTVVLDLIGFGIVLPILPLYVQDHGASAFTVGVVLAAYSAAQLVGSPVLGRLSDRFGRRPVLVIALIGSAVGHLVTASAGTVGLIIVARLFDGFSGGSLSIAHAAAADLAPPSQRPRLFGLLGAGIALGFVAGPALGALAALGGPRVPFIAAGALCAVNAASAWWRLPAFAPPGTPHPLHPTPQPERAAQGGRAGAGESLGLLSPSSVLGRTLLTSLVLGIGFAGFESTFSLLGRERVGLTEAKAGMVFAGVGIVLSIVQGLLVRRVIERIGPTRTARTAVTVNLVGFAVLIPAAGWTGLVPALLLLTVGQGLLTPAMSTVVSSLAPADRRGAVFGVQQSVGAASRVVGPLVALGLYGIGVPLPYVLGAGLAVLGLLAFASVPSRHPTPEPTPVH